MEPDEGQNNLQKNPDDGKTFRTLLSSRAFGACLALFSLCFILVYVFVFVDYRFNLVSDMAGFWERALERLNGGSFRLSQYIGWPPGYHIFLAEVFRLLRWLGLESLIRLETALTINILMYSLSVYALHRIAVRWFVQPPWILVVTLLYGFGLPAWYFNAFLLSENLSLPLLVMSIAVMSCRRDWKSLVFSAVLFGFAATIRPAISTLGLPFVIYLLFRWRLSWTFVVRAAVFSAVFFTIILAGGMEASRISHGRVQSLSACGGFQFFLANSRYFSVDMEFEGLALYVTSPAIAWSPENGRFKTDVPYYNQAYYYKLGWEYLKHDPLRLVKNFEHVKDLFFQRMFPGIETAGYAIFHPVWVWFKFIMLLSFGLYFWMWRGLSSDERPLFGFLIGVVGVTLLTSYLFTGEPRYTHAILFVFYLLFFKLAELFVKNWQRWKKVLLPFVLLLVVFGGIVLAVASVVNPSYPPTMKMQALPLSDQPDKKPEISQDVWRLFFPYNYYSLTIKHADTGYRPTLPTRFVTRTDLEIVGSDPLPLKFDICSAWPYRIMIDNNLVADEQGNDPKDPFVERNVFAALDPGMHTMEIDFDFVPCDGGFTLAYNYVDAENWNHRHQVGISDERIRFHLPKEDGKK